MLRGFTTAAISTSRWRISRTPCARPGRYSINHRGYLLVEFSDFLIPKTTDETFARMMKAGLRPIVTHPERNQLLQYRLPELEAWVAQGVHMQVTAQSLMGRFGKTATACAHELMGRGLVHFLASDAHDTRWRTTALDEARQYVDRRFGPEAGLRLFEENPRAALGRGAPDGGSAPHTAQALVRVLVERASSPAMPVFVPAFFEERRQRRRRCNLKGRSTFAGKATPAR